MHVGYGVIFQNPGNALSDAEVYRNELRLCDMVEPLGFDSVWSVEHHFDNYAMCPNPLQFLSYMAGKTSKIKLGSMVVVLPWHDPIRVAEQISLLDHISNGRFILGLGRGLARIEFEGFRLDQNDGRSRFVEYAELILNALESGYMEGGSYTRQPRRDIRPLPARSFKGRTFAAAVSPDSIPIMAKLGVGLLVNPQKPWEMVKEDFRTYHQVWTEVNGATPPPKPLCGGMCFVDENKDRAEEMAMKWITAYYRTVVDHYEMTQQHFGSHKTYEFYSLARPYLEIYGLDNAAKDFAKLMPWGTPNEVIEKIAFIKETIDANGVMMNFSYAGMPFDEVDRSLRLFAKKVLPELKRMETPDLVVPSALDLSARS
jgi:alkanesulfonate monooxygenase SsuD/methylene tetrahydromethanopterin reductase-like flavin-dependent oxidoreductase (luciferase family)